MHAAVFATSVRSVFGRSSRIVTPPRRITTTVVKAMGNQKSSAAAAGPNDFLVTYCKNCECTL